MGRTGTTRGLRTLKTCRISAVRPAATTTADQLGDERVRQPDPRTRWSTVAAPFVTPGEAAQIGERNHFAELLVQGGECSQFCDERGKKLALKMVENDRQV